MPNKTKTKINKGELPDKATKKRIRETFKYTAEYISAFNLSSLSTLPTITSRTISSFEHMKRFNK